MGRLAPHMQTKLRSRSYVESCQSSEVHCVVYMAIRGHLKDASLEEVYERS